MVTSFWCAGLYKHFNNDLTAALPYLSTTYPPHHTHTHAYPNTASRIMHLVIVLKLHRIGLRNILKTSKRKYIQTQFRQLFTMLFILSKA